MIVVTDIKYFEVEGDEHELYKNTIGPNELIRVSRNDRPEIMSASFVIEKIKGRRFRRRDGEWITGLSEEVAEIFQFQESAWRNMELELGLTRAALDSKQGVLWGIRNADWKTRLRWLFTGVPC